MTKQDLCLHPESGTNYIGHSVTASGIILSAATTAANGPFQAYYTTQFWTSLSKPLCKCTAVAVVQ